MELISILVAILIGGVIGALFIRMQTVGLKQKVESQEIELVKKQKMVGELEEAKRELARYEILVEQLNDKGKRELELTQQSNKALLEAEKEKWLREKEALLQSFEVERRAMNKAAEALHKTFEETKEEMNRQWKEKAELMKAQFEALANEVLEKKSVSLQDTSKVLLGSLLVPLKEKMEGFEKAVHEGREKGIANKVALEKLIENMMKQTQKIGEDAVNLTHALRGNSKIQGDWGEMLLESILEKSGLRKGEEYEVQANVKSDSGENFRPDVIVRFPEKRSIIIDSKVSLTAYVNYMSCEDENEREKYKKEHLLSIRRHVDELSEKDYGKFVKESIGYVLMFIPNEASYILALQNDSSIANYAYAKKIILINPTNLMMALQLAFNLWQSERQTRNVEEIIRRSNDLYDKFVVFTETFMKIEDGLNKASDAYNRAYKQLSVGNGNIVRRLEGLKELGLTPRKNISEKLKISEDE